MSRVVKREDCLAEVARFFKYYASFCHNPDPESIRGVLASAYSVNDKARKAGYPNFFASSEFLTIKAIRNYAVHQAGIYNQARAVPLVSTVPIETELATLCLVPKDVVERVCAAEGPKVAAAIAGSCVYYKNFVDIYPSIFNFGVQLYLWTEEHHLEVESAEYREFSKSIEFERVNNYPHTVNGGIRLPEGGDVDEFIESHLHTMEQKLALQSVLYSESDGMYTFVG